MATQGLVSAKQMVQVCLGKPRINGGVSLRIQKAEVSGPLGVAQIDGPFEGENLTVAAIARRHYTIKHVNAKSDGFQHIGRSTYAHEVARAVFRQDGADLGRHSIHFIVGFAHT